MDLLNELITKIFYNLYSYTVYIVIGILIYLLVNHLIVFLKFDLTKTVVLLIVLSIVLPICSCISITFLIYKQVVKNENILLLIYILSLFFNISIFIYLYIYLNLFSVIIYVIYILLCSFVIISFNIDLKSCIKINKSLDRVSFIDNIKYISKFVTIHFFGILLMSILDVVFKSIGYINGIVDNKDLIFLFINNIFLKYTCLPYDISLFLPLIYGGFKITFILALFVASVLANIPELVLLISIIKNKLLLFVVVIFSSVFFYITSLIFDNNDAFYKISINYNESLLKLATALNFNSNIFMKYVSIIIYIIFILFYVFKEKFIMLMDNS